MWSVAENRLKARLIGLFRRWLLSRGHDAPVFTTCLPVIARLNPIYSSFSSFCIKAATVWNNKNHPLFFYWFVYSLLKRRLWISRSSQIHFIFTFFSSSFLLHFPFSLLRCVFVFSFLARFCFPPFVTPLLHGIYLLTVFRRFIYYFIILSVC